MTQEQEEILEWIQESEFVLSFLSTKLPKAIWEPLKALEQRICIDIDERNGELSQQLEPYQKLLHTCC